MSRRAPGATSPETTAATIGLLALTITTAVGYCRVFDGWEFLPMMAVVAVVCHGVAAALRSVRVPFLIALPVSLAALAEVVAFVHYRDTLAGPFPTRQTFEFARLDLTLVWDQFPTAVAPVPSSGGYAVGAALALGLAAIASDAFAFRAFGRAEAAVPSGVLMVFTAALGVDRNRVVLSALWVAVALCCVALLRLAHGRSEGAWLGRPTRAMARAVPAAVVLAAAVAGIAAAAGPRLPGAGDAALVDTRNRSGDVTEVVSPLVDIRSRLVNQSNLEYFTMQAPQAAYWRLTGLAVFNGSTWGLPSRSLSNARGRFEDVDRGDVEITQTLTIKAMDGQLLPAAFKPVATSSPGLQWVSDTATLVLTGADGTEPGMTFEITSAIGEPSADVLRRSTVSSPPDSIYLDLPDSFPRGIVGVARDVTAGAATPYDQAVLLQNWFRTEFTYNLDVQRGHSIDSIESFLRLREGYCEQFAGAFAAMARSIGLPARVAVGFTPGDLQADGLFHVRGRNAHAWPEVWFDDAGWVLFEPTPGRGAPGAEGTTGVSPAQEPAFDGGGAADQAPSQSVPQTTSPSATPASSPVDAGLPDLIDPGLDGGATPAAPVDDGGGSIPPWAIVLAVLAAVAIAWTALSPWVFDTIAARRAGHDAPGRIARAWHRALAAAEMLGVEARTGDTALEYAGRARLDPVARAALDQLAQQATRAFYAPAEPDGDTAARCEKLARDLHHMALAELPWTARLRARVDPRVGARLHGLALGR